VGDNVRTWDAVTGKELRVLSGHREAGAAVAHSRDGRTVAVGRSGTVGVRDGATGNLLRSFPAPEGPGLALALSPGRRALAMPGTGRSGVAAEKFIWLGVVAAGEGLRRIGEDESGVTSLAFSPDGTKLAARSPGHIRVWDGATGARVSDIKGMEEGAA